MYNMLVGSRPTFTLVVICLTDINAAKLCQLCCKQGNQCKPFVGASNKPIQLNDDMGCKYGACNKVRIRLRTPCLEKTCHFYFFKQLRETWIDFNIFWRATSQRNVT